jgi:acyl dehydratase
MTGSLEASFERSFKQSDFDRFARLSGDDNPIHVDAEFSARTRFGRPVAHGLFLCSVLRGLVDKLVPGGRLIEQSVMFPAPTFTEEAIRFTVTVTSRGQEESESSLECQLEAKRISDGVVTCQGMGKVLI